jgi:hypothetical protein
MTEDPDNEGGGDSPRPRRNREGGDGGGALLSLLLFAFRYPKLSLVLLLIGGTYVYCSDDPTPDDARPVAADTSGSTSQKDKGAGRLGTGATLDPKVYDEALVYEPLAERGNPEPAERVSLLRYAPKRLSQGAQGSCVGWATSYAARTILYARETGRAPDEVAFSPSFLYNQIALDDCDGSYLVRAMEVLQRTGDLPFKDFSYTASSCNRRPTRDEKQRAGDYRITGFTRLSIDSDDYRTNAEALKQNLAQGAPVVIGMRVGGSFEEDMDGKRVWRPTQSDYKSVEKWGGHAMAVIGYDDALEGGAFQLMNSWGSDWGEDGVAWVRYKDFDHFVREAYGLYPMGEARRESNGPQVVRFGLVEYGTLQRIPLKKVDGRVFRTVSPIRKGTRFKVEFSNTQPCYTYLFGQETDGSSYVLFPYTEKHSPYCGTTGTRIFPRKQSLTADELGTRDSVAVVISPRELDYRALNARISAHPGATYSEKLEGALGNQLRSDLRARTRDQLIELTAAPAAANDTGVHALVIEFDKE